MSDHALYDADYLEWTRRQAAALRAAERSGTNLPLDWENLAEEVEDMGKSQLSELENRTATIIEHLLKLQFSPAREPRGDWQETILRSRLRIQRLFRQSPSLRPMIDQIILDSAEDGRKVASLNLARYGEFLPDQLPAYTPDQVLGDWFPDGPREGS